MAERKKAAGRRSRKHLPGGYLLPRRLTRLVPDNCVDILRNGDQFFPALLESIGSARESVYLDFYRINDDRAGKAVGELLSEKARQGVEVGIIYDDIGSFASGEYFKWLTSSGVRTAAFNPVSLFRSRLGINRRDHRKMVIVDGRVGFMGGLNIADEYGDPADHWKGWRDTAVKVEGPVVRQMVSIFLASWKRLAGFPIEHARKYLGETGSREGCRVGGMSAFVVGTERILTRREAIKAYRKAVWKAKRSIFIQSAYFIPPYTMRLAFRKAAQRGVSVKIIVPLQGDLFMNDFASRRTFSPLMKAGVEIFQLPGPIMHAKTAVIDGAWSTVGSFNQNHRSFFHDLEVNLLVIDEAFGAKMEKSFIEDLAKAIPVDPRKWRVRPFGEKLFERFCYSLRHVL